MCSAEGCDSSDLPPPGEGWCPRRLDIEMERWLTGWPSMREPKPLRDLMADLRQRLSEDT